MTMRSEIGLFFRGNVLVPALIGAAVALTLSASLSSFGARNAKADAPPNRYTLTATTAQDVFTGLTWQRAQSATTMNFSDAQNYCQTQLPAGWRLPSPKELLTIVDDSVKTAPTIDQTAFPATSPASFWTGVASARGAGYAWAIDFNVANLDEDDNDNPNAANLYRVRCVK